MSSADELLVRVRLKGPDIKKFQGIVSHHGLSDSDALRFCVRFSHYELVRIGEIPPDCPMNRDFAFKLLSHLYPDKDMEEMKKRLGKSARFDVEDVRVVGE
jgi:hypothetical protein